MRAEAGTLLKIDGLTTSFTTKQGTVNAVDGISLEVQRGKILGLVGESGSGKSVTGYSILGLVEPPGRVTAGRILFYGIDLLQLSQEELRTFRGNRISMVFQDPMMTLNPVLRVETQMVEVVLNHRRDISREGARVLARDMLGRMGIPSPDERLRAYPHQLSGGMCQRVAIATALLNEPDLVIADEPTTALDVTIQSQILAEVQEMCQRSGTALLWITHDLGVVSGLADDICVMYAGRIVEQGPVGRVINAPLHPYTRGLIDSVPSIRQRGELLVAIPGSTPPLHSLPSGCSFHPRCTRRDANTCLTDPPASREIIPARYARCHHPLELVS